MYNVQFMLYTCTCTCIIHVDLKCIYTVFLSFTLCIYLNFRGYFESAHQSYKNHGDASELYVIIIDEIEAICKPRGNMQHIYTLMNEKHLHVLRLRELHVHESRVASEKIIGFNVISS